MAGMHVASTRTTTVHMLSWNPMNLAWHTVYHHLRLDKACFRCTAKAKLQQLEQPAPSELPPATTNLDIVLLGFLLLLGLHLLFLLLALRLLLLLLGRLAPLQEPGVDPALAGLMDLGCRPKPPTPFPSFLTIKV